MRKISVLFGLSMLGLAACEPDPVPVIVRIPSSPDVVETSPAPAPTPEPPKAKTFALSRAAATRVAAQVVALSVLTGRQEQLAVKSHYAGFPLYGKHLESQSAREFGLGLPLAHWETLTPTVARKAMAAILASKVADDKFNGVSGATNGVTFSELRAARCEIALLDGRVPDLESCLRNDEGVGEVEKQALACATAIVERNVGAIDVLAGFYERDLQPDGAKMYNYLVSPLCSKNNGCVDLYVHTAAFRVNELDLLTSDRKGLPTFCNSQRETLPPYPEGGEPIDETSTQAEATATIAAHQLVAGYVFSWDLDKLRAAPGTNVILGRALTPSDYADGKLARSEERLYASSDVLLRQSGYAERHVIGDFASTLARGDDGDYALNRRGHFSARTGDKKALCNEMYTDTVQRLVPNDDTSFDRVIDLLRQRCEDFGEYGQTGRLPASQTRALQARIAKIDTCAKAFNKQNAKAIAEMKALVQARIEKAVPEVDANTGGGVQVIRVKVTNLDILPRLDRLQPSAPAVCK